MSAASSRVSRRRTSKRAPIRDGIVARCEISADPFPPRRPARRSGRSGRRAKLLLDAAKDNADHAELFAFLGRAELKQRRYDEAIAHLQQALNAAPQATALYNDLADAYQGKGQTAQAEAARAKAGDVAPVIDDPIIAGIYDTHSSKPLTGTPMQRARQLISQQQFVAARGELEEAIKTNPNDVEAIALAARLDALLGVPALAQDEATRALKIDANNASANLSQGMIYEFGGDEAKAQPYYQRAAKADPNLPDPHLLLGNALMRKSRFADAAEEYRKVVVIDPASTEGQGRLAAALVSAGRCREAINGLNTALAARSRDGDLLQVFVRLAATCNAATLQERAMALDYGQALYKQRPNAADTVALALAQAANGKFDDAQKSQAEAIFEAERSRDANAPTRTAKRCACTPRTRFPIARGRPIIRTSSRRCWSRWTPNPRPDCATPPISSPSRAWRDGAHAGADGSARRRRRYLPAWSGICASTATAPPSAASTIDSNSN